MHHDGRIWGNFNFMSRGQNGEIKRNKEDLDFHNIRKVDQTSPLPFLDHTKFGGYRAFLSNLTFWLTLYDI